MRFDVTVSSNAELRRAAKAFDKAQAAAMHVAVDRATRLAQKGIQDKIKAVGLGRLSGAVRSTSSERKRRRTPENAWGAIYAAGGDESRAGQALEAYTAGATIRGRNVTWLAIATRALPKKVGRYRMTPARYEAAGAPLGPLVFKRISANRAILIAQGDFKVSVKTGRAKHATGRRTRSSTRQRDVVAFVLIKETKRARRFDQADIARAAAERIGAFINDALQDSLPQQASSR